MDSISTLHLLPFAKTKRYWNKELLEIMCINFNHWTNDPDRNFYLCGIYLFKSKNENTRPMCNSVPSKQQRHQNDVNHVILLSLFLTLNVFHRLLWCLSTFDLVQVNTGCDTTPYQTRN